MCSVALNPLFTQELAKRPKKGLTESCEKRACFSRVIKWLEIWIGR